MLAANLSGVDLVKAPRVLHVITGLNIGGAERLLMRFLCLDPANKENCVVVSLSTHGKVANELHEAGFVVYALGIQRLILIPYYFIKLTKIIREFKPDIVQTWLYHADFLGGLAARIVGVKHVIWGLLGTEIDKKIFSSTWLIRTMCVGLSYMIPSKIMCVAEATKETHHKLGYCFKKMQFFHNGLDFSKLHATGNERKKFRLEHGIAETDIVIGSLGRFHPLKDHLTFIKAIEKLSKFIPNLKVLIVGRNLTYSNDILAAWIEATGFSKNFVLCGETSDISSCLVAMDIFCLHSRAEGLPTVLAEAMAMALPCVSTDVGDAGLLMGNTGILVNKQNVDALVEGLLQVIRMTPEERMALGKAAQVKVKKEYSIEQTQKEFMDVYDELMIKRVVKYHGI